jgi:ABC-type branched-subunit amino acid transport system substrate-binding protein
MSNVRCRRVSAQSGPRYLTILYILACFAWAGCSRVLSLEEYAVAAEVPDAQTPAFECNTNRDCPSDANAPKVCVEATHTCVALKSEDCTTVTGDFRSENPIVIGSMFAFGGAQAGASMARQNAALLAVHEINGAGGIPRGDSSANARALVMVSCDASANLARAGRHLVEELHVPAIVGPNGSQDTIELSRQVSVPGGTVVITPTALASSIADLSDNGLTWQMVPTDLQRGPFLTLQIEDMAVELMRARKLPSVRFAAVFRDDALGIGTRTSLNELTLNGEPLPSLVSRGSAHIDAYDLDAVDQQPIVRSYVELAPDIIVLAGTSELVQNVMVPLEQAWRADRPRPYYMLIDSLKNKELLDAVAGNDDLRKRIRGTGLTPSPRSINVYDAFQLSYQLAYPGTPSEVAGLGPSYDTVYAIAYALAATQGQPGTGRSVAEGLRMLSDGRVEIEVQAVTVLAAFSRLATKEPITAIGTFGPLAWGPNGAVLGGTLELWCIENIAGRLSYQSSGLTLDLASGLLEGSYKQCE